MVAFYVIYLYEWENFFLMYKLGIFALYYFWNACNLSKSKSILCWFLGATFLLLKTVTTVVTEKMKKMHKSLRHVKSWRQKVLLLKSQWQKAFFIETDSGIMNICPESIQFRMTFSMSKLTVFTRSKSYPEVYSEPCQTSISKHGSIISPWSKIERFAKIVNDF